MKKLLSLLLVLTLLVGASPAEAALSASGVIQIQSTATAGNVNSGYFNPANANLLTDGAATSGTGNAAVFTSASYNFVAGDANAWIYIASGSGWNPVCYYKITSVAANAATLDTTAGHGVCVALNRYTVTGSAGVGSASPTGATWGIDYSMLDTAPFVDTDLASLTGTTTPCTVTSVTHPFGVQDVGNGLHINSGTSWTAGWYEIVSVSGVTATLDKACGSSATLTAGTAKMGGALSLGSGDSTIFSNSVASTSATASTRYFIKGNATYTLSGAVSAPTASNAAWPSIVEGYNSLRGDRPTDSTRPILNMAASTFSASSATWLYRSLQFTGTASQVVTAGKFYDSKFTNTSTTAGLVAWHGGNSSYCINCEGVSYRGNAFDANSNNGFVALNCYVHDSNQGISLAGGSGATIISGCIFANNVTTGLNIGTALTQSTPNSMILNNTFYGAENKLGTAITIPTGSNTIIFRNNIYYGFTTGVSATDVSTANLDSHSDFFNNTTDVNDTTKYQKGASDLALDPTFAGVAQRTGSTATTTAGNHLVQSGATFVSWGVTPGRDFLYVSAGTGVTAGKYGILSVDSETQITTDISLSADATSDKSWQITTGRNFQIGVNLKAAGSPSAFPGGYTTGYTDIGAVQRQENTSPTVHSSTFVQ